MRQDLSNVSQKVERPDEKILKDIINSVQKEIINKLRHEFTNLDEMKEELTKVVGLRQELTRRERRIETIIKELKNVLKEYMMFLHKFYVLL